jgi:hypothetical protein
MKLKIPASPSFNLLCRPCLRIYESIFYGTLYIKLFDKKSTTLVKRSSHSGSVPNEALGYQFLELV